MPIPVYLFPSRNKHNITVPKDLKNFNGVGNHGFLFSIWYCPYRASGPKFSCRYFYNLSSWTRCASPPLSILCTFKMLYTKMLWFLNIILKRQNIIVFPRNPYIIPLTTYVLLFLLFPFCRYSHTIYNFLAVLPNFLNINVEYITFRHKI